MYPTLFTTTLFFALAALHVAADFTVYTPAFTQVSKFSNGVLPSHSLTSVRFRP